MSNIDTYDEDDHTVYALTWHSPEGHLVYWSLTKGWTYSCDHAWTLTRSEVDNIEDDERLLRNLPQHKERKEGANWEPVFQRFQTYYADSVNDNDP